jgi:hypothetical protein
MTHATIPASVYADAARLKKILFLTGSIDSALGMMNVDAFSPQALHFVEAMTDAAWRCAASSAGVLMPSATTIAAIEDLYRKRVEVRACLDRVVKSAGGGR